ncbi:MAG TPA: hypothetical protein VIL48_07585 [Acidimicrobiales bacterium]
MSRAVTTAAAVALSVAGLAACGDDGGEAATAATVEPGPAPQEPDEIAEGCGSQAVTNPADLRADRDVARCGPGAPEPAPLPARTTVRVAVPPAPGEELAPVLLADRLGEFEAENLEVEIVEEPPGEAMADLAAGRLDAVAGPLGGAYLDAVHDGTGARAVLGGALTRAPYRLDTDQTGLWLRRSAVENPDNLSRLESQPVGVPGGAAGAALYPVSRAIEERSGETSIVNLTDVAGDEAAERLRAGELAAAWLDGASWLAVADDADFQLLGTLPATESIDGTVFAQRLTSGPDRAVGVAFVRAVIRTINTYLTGDYQSDDEVVAALAEATGTDAEAVTATPALLFDWELRDGTVERIEEVLLRTGGVGYEEPQPPDRFVDRSLARDAVGAGG